jgi:hypothetical protein
MKEEKRPIKIGTPEQGRFGLPKRPYDERERLNSTLN